jgi:uncharacterized protein (UPF0335 family)
MLTRLRALSDVLLEDRKPPDFEPASLIEEFEDLLLIHFAAEEAEEFFGSLVTEEPRLLDRVARLQDEHAELAAAVDELLESCHSEAPRTQLAERIQRFLERLDAHECAENELMQELILIDEGGGA